MKKSELNTSNVTLTDKEFKIVQIFLADNGSGAITPEELLDDNFSCQTIKDLRDLTGKSNKEIGGILSSLQTKGIIYLDDRDGPFCKSKNKAVQMNFEPDLYWVDDDYLKQLKPNLKFWDDKK